MRPALLAAVLLVACRGKDETVAVALPAPSMSVVLPIPGLVASAPASAPVASVASLPPPNLPPLSAGAVLTLNVSEGRTPTLSGETNLPDGTDLAVLLVEGPCQFLLTPGGNYSGKAIVHGGRWSARFGTGEGADQPVRDGTFEANAFTTSPSGQPLNVQSVIGAKGERLKGRQIKNDTLGGLSVDIAHRVTFGDRREAPKLTRDRCAAEVAKMKKLGGP